MKKINILLVCGSIFLCGCNKSNNDSAKIEELSQKLDIVISNQAAISARLSVLPSVNDMNDMSLFYFSNSVVSLKHVHSEISSIAEMSQLQGKMSLDGFSNVLSDTAEIKMKLGAQ